MRKFLLGGVLVYFCVTRAQVSAATFAEQVLDAEAPLASVTPDMRQLVSDIQEEVRRRVQPRGPMTKSGAVEVLSEFHRVLARRGFVVAPDGYVGLLSQALTATEISAAELEAVRSSIYSRGPRAEWLESAAGSGSPIVYFADCDTLAFLYMSMGDVIGFPLELVERPASDDQVGHNWVQWTNGRESVGWETLTGAEHPVANAMTRAQALAYARRVVAWYLQLRGLHRAAAAAYATSIAEYRSPGALNGYAWLLATSWDPKVKNGALAKTLAVELIDKACDANRLDTAAAAYAANGEFGVAVAVQRAAIARVGTARRAKLADFEARAVLYEHGMRYVEARPERQAELDSCLDHFDKLFSKGSGGDEARLACLSLSDANHIRTWAELERAALMRHPTVRTASFVVPHSCPPTVNP